MSLAISPNWPSKCWSIRFKKLNVSWKLPVVYSFQCILTLELPVTNMTNAKNVQYVWDNDAYRLRQLKAWFTAVCFYVFNCYIWVHSAKWHGDLTRSVTAGRINQTLDVFTMPVLYSSHWKQCQCKVVLFHQYCESLDLDFLKARLLRPRLSVSKELLSDNAIIYCWSC